MKTFVIIDEPVDKVMGYLFYYEQSDRFYIEIPEHLTEWELPMILSSFAKRNQYSMDAYWSCQWVRQRLVPPDRQNIAAILKNAHLSEYHEFKLMVLSEARCSHDDCYVRPIGLSEIPEAILARFEHHCESVLPLSHHKMLVFFRNSTAKECDLQAIVGNRREYGRVLSEDTVFRSVSLQTDGYGIQWGERLTVGYDVLYEAGKKVDITLTDIHTYIRNHLVSTSAAAQMLNCTKQNIADLTQRGKLTPIKETEKSKWFLKDDIEKRKWS